MRDGLVKNLTLLIKDEQKVDNIVHMTVRN